MKTKTNAKTLLCIKFKYNWARNEIYFRVDAPLNVVSHVPEQIKVGVYPYILPIISTIRLKRSNKV